MTDPDPWASTAPLPNYNGKGIVLQGRKIYQDLALLRQAAAALRTYAAAIEPVSSDCDKIVREKLGGWKGKSSEAFMWEFSTSFTGNFSDYPAALMYTGHTQADPALPALYAQVVNAADGVETMAKRLEDYLIARLKSAAVEFDIGMLTLAAGVITVELGGIGAVATGAAGFALESVITAGWFAAGDAAAQLANMAIMNPVLESQGDDPIGFNWAEFGVAVAAGFATGAAGWGTGQLLKGSMPYWNPVLRQVTTRMLGAGLGVIGDGVLQLGRPLIDPQDYHWLHFDTGELATSALLGALMGGRVHDLFASRPTITIDAPGYKRMYATPRDENLFGLGKDGTGIDPAAKGLRPIDLLDNEVTLDNKPILDLRDPKTGDVIGNIRLDSSNPDNPRLIVETVHSTVDDLPLNGTKIQTHGTSTVPPTDGPAGKPMRYQKSIAFDVSDGKLVPKSQVEVSNGDTTQISVVNEHGVPQLLERQEHLTTDQQVRLSTGKPADPWPGDPGDRPGFAWFPKGSQWALNAKGQVVAAVRPTEPLPGLDSVPRGSSDLFTVQDGRLDQLGWVTKPPGSRTFDFQDMIRGRETPVLPGGSAGKTVVSDGMQRFSFNPKSGRTELAFPVPVERLTALASGVETGQTSNDGSLPLASGVDTGQTPNDRPPRMPGRSYQDRPPPVKITEFRRLSPVTPSADRAAPVARSPLWSERAPSTDGSSALKPAIEVSVETVKEGAVATHEAGAAVGKEPVPLSEYVRKSAPPRLPVKEGGSDPITLAERRPPSSEAKPQEPIRAETVADHPQEPIKAGPVTVPAIGNSAPTKVPVLPPRVPGPPDPPGNAPAKPPGPAQIVPTADSTSSPLASRQDPRPPNRPQPSLRVTPQVTPPSTHEFVDPVKTEVTPATGDRLPRPVGPFATPPVTDITRPVGPEVVPPYGSRAPVDPGQAPGPRQAPVPNRPVAPLPPDRPVAPLPPGRTAPPVIPPSAPSATPTSPGPPQITPLGPPPPGQGARPVPEITPPATRHLPDALPSMVPPPAFTPPLVPSTTHFPAPTPAELPHSVPEVALPGHRPSTDQVSPPEGGAEERAREILRTFRLDERWLDWFQTFYGTDFTPDRFARFIADLLATRGRLDLVSREMLLHFVRRAVQATPGTAEAGQIMLKLRELSALAAATTGPGTDVRLDPRVPSTGGQSGPSRAAIIRQLAPDMQEWAQQLARDFADVADPEVQRWIAEIQEAAKNMAARPVGAWQQLNQALGKLIAEQEAAEEIATSRSAASDGGQEAGQGTPAEPAEVDLNTPEMTERERGPVFDAPPGSGAGEPVPESTSGGAAPEIWKPMSPETTLVYPHAGLVFSDFTSTTGTAKSGRKPSAEELVPALVAELFVAGGNMGVVEKEIKSLLPWLVDYTKTFDRELVVAARPEANGIRILISRSANGENSNKFDISSSVKAYAEPIPLLHTHPVRSRAEASNRDHGAIDPKRQPYSFVLGPETGDSAVYVIVRFDPALRPEGDVRIPPKKTYKPVSLAEFQLGNQMKKTLREGMLKAAEEAAQRVTSLTGGPLQKGMDRAKDLVGAIAFLGNVEGGRPSLSPADGEAGAFQSVLYQALDVAGKPGGMSAEAGGDLERAYIHYARGEAFAPDIERLLAFRDLLIQEYRKVWPRLPAGKRPGVPAPAELPRYIARLEDVVSLSKTQLGRTNPYFDAPGDADPRRLPESTLKDVRRVMNRARAGVASVAEIEALAAELQSTSSAVQPGQARQIPWLQGLAGEFHTLALAVASGDKALVKHRVADMEGVLKGVTGGGEPSAVSAGKSIGTGSAKALAQLGVPADQIPKLLGTHAAKSERTLSAVLHLLGTVKARQFGIPDESFVAFLVKGSFLGVDDFARLDAAVAGLPANVVGGEKLVGGILSKSTSMAVFEQRLAELTEVTAVAMANPRGVVHGGIELGDKKSKLAGGLARKFSLDPWVRAGAELDIAYTGSDGKLNVAEIKHVARGLDHSNSVAQIFRLMEWLQGDPGGRKAYVRIASDEKWWYLASNYKISGKDSYPAAKKALSGRDGIRLITLLAEAGVHLAVGGIEFTPGQVAALNSAFAARQIDFKNPPSIDEVARNIKRRRDGSYEYDPHSRGTHRPDIRAQALGAQPQRLPPSAIAKARDLLDQVRNDVASPDEIEAYAAELDAIFEKRKEYPSRWIQLFADDFRGLLAGSDVPELLEIITSHLDHIGVDRPDADLPPAEIKQWWDSLTPEWQESLQLTHDSEIAALDGIPAMVRDRINRGLLSGHKAEIVEEIHRIESLPRRDGANRKLLADLNDTLNGIHAVEDRLAVPPGAGYQRPHLLLLSPRGVGSVIIAVGDPDTAANVVTYVPGTLSRLGTVDTSIKRVDAIAAAAAEAGSPSTAVIAWIGYEAPQSIVPQAMRRRFAEAAKLDLLRFQEGLSATHEGSSAHKVVIGYSYGTLVVGLAARHGDLGADDVVFAASTGVGARTAADLRLNGVEPHEMTGHVYSTFALHDMAKIFAGFHGRPPTSAGFRGTRFISDPGLAGPWYMLRLSRPAHQQYFEPGNAALANIAKIITGGRSRARLAGGELDREEHALLPEPSATLAAEATRALGNALAGETADTDLLSLHQVRTHLREVLGIRQQRSTATRRVLEAFFPAHTGGEKKPANTRPSDGTVRANGDIDPVAGQDPVLREAFLLHQLAKLQEEQAALIESVRANQAAIEEEAAERSAAIKAEASVELGRLHDLQAGNNATARIEAEQVAENERIEAEFAASMRALGLDPEEVLAADVASNVQPTPVADEPPAIASVPPAVQNPDPPTPAGAAQGVSSGSQAIPAGTQSPTPTPKAVPAPRRLPADASLTNLVDALTEQQSRTTALDQAEAALDEREAPLLSIVGALGFFRKVIAARQRHLDDAQESRDRYDAQALAMPVRRGFTYLSDLRLRQSLLDQWAENAAHDIEEVEFLEQVVEQGKRKGRISAEQGAEVERLFQTFPKFEDLPASIVETLPKGLHGKLFDIRRFVVEAVKVQEYLNRRGLGPLLESGTTALYSARRQHLIDLDRHILETRSQVVAHNAALSVARQAKDPARVAAVTAARRSLLAGLDDALRERRLLDRLVDFSLRKNPPELGREVTATEARVKELQSLLQAATRTDDEAAITSLSESLTRANGHLQWAMAQRGVHELRSRLAEAMVGVRQARKAGDPSRLRTAKQQGHRLRAAIEALQSVPEAVRSAGALLSELIEVEMALADAEEATNAKVAATTDAARVQRIQQAFSNRKKGLENRRTRLEAALETELLLLRDQDYPERGSRLLDAALGGDREAGVLILDDQRLLRWIERHRDLRTVETRRTEEPRPLPLDTKDPVVRGIFKTAQKAAPKLVRYAFYERQHQEAMGYEPTIHLLDMRLQEPHPTKAAKLDRKMKRLTKSTPDLGAVNSYGTHVIEMEDVHRPGIQGVRKRLVEAESPEPAWSADSIDVVARHIEDGLGAARKERTHLDSERARRTSYVSRLNEAIDAIRELERLRRDGAAEAAVRAQRERVATARLGLTGWTVLGPEALPVYQTIDGSELSSKYLRDGDPRTWGEEIKEIREVPIDVPFKLHHTHRDVFKDARRSGKLIPDFVGGDLPIESTIESKKYIVVMKDGAEYEVTDYVHQTLVIRSGSLLEMGLAMARIGGGLTTPLSALSLVPKHAVRFGPLTLVFQVPFGVNTDLQYIPELRRDFFVYEHVGRKTTKVKRRTAHGDPRRSWEIHTPATEIKLVDDALKTIQFYVKWGLQLQLVPMVVVKVGDPSITNLDQLVDLFSVGGVGVAQLTGEISHFRDARTGAFIRVDWTAGVEGLYGLFLGLMDRYGPVRLVPDVSGFLNWKPSPSTVPWNRVWTIDVKPLLEYIRDAVLLKLPWVDRFVQRRLESMNRLEYKGVATQWAKDRRAYLLLEALKGHGGPADDEGPQLVLPPPRGPKPKGPRGGPPAGALPDGGKILLPLTTPPSNPSAPPQASQVQTQVHAMRASDPRRWVHQVQSPQPLQAVSSVAPTEAALWTARNAAGGPLPTPSPLPARPDGTPLEPGVAQALDRALARMTEISTLLENLARVTDTITPLAWTAQKAHGHPLRDPHLSERATTELRRDLERAAHLANRLRRRHTRIHELYERVAAAVRADDWQIATRDNQRFAEALTAEIHLRLPRLGHALDAVRAGGSLTTVSRAIQQTEYQLDPAQVAVRTLASYGPAEEALRTALRGAPEKISALVRAVERVRSALQVLADPAGTQANPAGTIQRAYDDLALALRLATETTPIDEATTALTRELRGLTRLTTRLVQATWTLAPAADVAKMAEETAELIRLDDELAALQAGNGELREAYTTVSHRLRRLTEASEIGGRLQSRSTEITSGTVPPLAVLRQGVKADLQARDNLARQDRAAEEWWDRLPAPERAALLDRAADALRNAGLSEEDIATVGTVAKYHLFAERNPHLRADPHHQDNVRRKEIRARLQSLRAEAATGPAERRAAIEAEQRILDAELTGIAGHERALANQALAAALRQRRDAMAARTARTLPAFAEAVAARSTAFKAAETALNAEHAKTGRGTPRSAVATGEEVDRLYRNAERLAAALAGLASLALTPADDGDIADASLRFVESRVQRLSEQIITELDPAVRAWQRARDTGTSADVTATESRLNAVLRDLDERLLGISYEASRHRARLAGAPERRAAEHARVLGDIAADKRVWEAGDARTELFQATQRGLPAERYRAADTAIAAVRAAHTELAGLRALVDDLVSRVPREGDQLTALRKLPRTVAAATELRTVSMDVGAAVHALLDAFDPADPAPAARPARDLRAITRRLAKSVTRIQELRQELAEHLATSLPARVGRLATTIAVEGDQAALTGSRLTALVADVAERRAAAPGGWAALLLGDLGRELAGVDDLTREVQTLARLLAEPAAQFAIGGPRRRRGPLDIESGGIPAGTDAAVDRVRQAAGIVYRLIEGLRAVHEAARTVVDHVDADEWPQARGTLEDVRRAMTELRGLLADRDRFEVYRRAIAVTDKLTLPAAADASDLVPAEPPTSVVASLEAALRAIEGTEYRKTVEALETAARDAEHARDDALHTDPASPFHDPRALLEHGGRVVAVRYVPVGGTRTEHPWLVPREGEFGRSWQARALAHPIDLVRMILSMDRRRVRTFAKIEYLIEDAAGGRYLVTVVDQSIEEDRGTPARDLNEDQTLKTAGFAVKIAPGVTLKVTPFEQRPTFTGKVPRTRWEHTVETVTVRPDGLSAGTRWRKAHEPRYVYGPAPAVETAHMMRFKLAVQISPPGLPGAMFTNIQVSVTKKLGSQHELGSLRIQNLQELLDFLASGSAEKDSLQIELSLGLLRIRLLPDELLHLFALLPFVGDELYDLTYLRLGEFKLAYDGPEAQAVVLRLLEPIHGGMLLGADPMRQSRLVAPPLFSWLQRLFVNPRDFVAALEERPGAYTPMSAADWRLTTLRGWVNGALNTLGGGSGRVAVETYRHTAGIVRNAGMLADAVEKGRISQASVSAIGRLARRADEVAKELTGWIEAPRGGDARQEFDRRKAALRSVVEEIERLLPPPPQSPVTSLEPRRTVPPAQPASQPAAQVQAARPAPDPVVRRNASSRPDPEPKRAPGPRRPPPGDVPPAVADLIRAEAAKLAEQARRNVENAVRTGAITQAMADEIADLAAGVQRFAELLPGEGLSGTQVTSHADAVRKLRERLRELPPGPGTAGDVPKNGIRTTPLAKPDDEHGDITHSGRLDEDR